MNIENISQNDIDNLRHMLGVGEHINKKEWGYRNYFAAGESQIEEMERLVSAGLVTRGSDSGKLKYYHANEKGMDYIGMSAAAKRRAMEP